MKGCKKVSRIKSWKYSRSSLRLWAKKFALELSKLHMQKILSKKQIDFLFFAVYVIYKKTYSFSRVVFLFFSVQNCQLFLFKKNDSSRVRTTAFSSSRFGVLVSVVPNIFAISQHFLIPEISETLKGSFTKFFGTVRQKIFDGKLWYPYYA